MTCLICNSKDLRILNSSASAYYNCLNCDFLFLNPATRLSPNEEKKIYLSHENNIHDLDYQKFVSPLVAQIKQRLSTGAKGLDFGSGTGPALSYLLNKAGYLIEQYDPFFAPNTTMIEGKYHFVASCEVVEHLFNPVDEFKKIHSWLKPKGLFVAKTHLWAGQDLRDWYYVRDPSHVSFYNAKSLLKLTNTVGFSQLELIDDRVFVLTK